MESAKGFVKFMHWGKDGGPESRVWGFWFGQIKPLFSVALLRFETGTRQAYHTHAFNSISWVLQGSLLERFWDWRSPNRQHNPGWRPVITRRSDFHQVQALVPTWVLTFRGPWADTWKEGIPVIGENGLPIGYEVATLTHGRRVL